MNYPNLPDAVYPIASRFGPRDIEVMTQPHLKDGTVLLYGMRYLWIGTCPLSLMEEVGREARLIVRDGLRDVMDWCGMKYDDEPGGYEILRRIRAAGDVVPWMP